MIVSEKDRDKIRQIIQYLKNYGEFPYRETIIGSLLNVLRNLIGVTLEVDTWPNFTSLISRLHLPVDPEESTNVPIQCYTTDGDNLKELINNSTIIPWNRKFVVCALPIEYETIWREECNKRKGQWKREKNTFYYFICDIDNRRNERFIDNLPPGFTIGKLQPDHAGLVSSCWQFGKTKTAEKRIKCGIEHLPTICIYNERGEPVSWNNTHLDGSGAIGHTLDDYRRLGLYKINMAEINFRQSQANMIQYGYIADGNVGAMKSTIPGATSDVKVVFGEFHPTLQNKL